MRRNGHCHPPGWRAVSYTHLDVYKRQVESGGTQRSGSGAVVCDEHYASFRFGGGSRVPFFFEHAAGYAGMRILYCGGGLEPVSGKRGAVRLSDPAGMDPAFDHAAVLGIGTAPLDR